MSEQKTGRTVQEQLEQLLAEGKKTGKLPSKRLLDTLDQLDAEPEVLEQFYDALESAPDKRSGGSTGWDTSGSRRFTTARRLAAAARSAPDGRCGPA